VEEFKGFFFSWSLDCFQLKKRVLCMARCKRVLTPAAAIANLELEEAELLNRLRSTQEKQRLAYRSFPPQGYNRVPVCCVS
jgi:hypothetical protein